MKITNPEDLKIGDAVTFCCHLDLIVIDSAEKLEEVASDWDDDFAYEAWSSAHEAYIEIAMRWPEGSEERAECERLARSNKV